jgi:hypothetical protein
MTTIQALSILSIASLGLPLTLALTGCAGNDITQPSDVTLEQGMQSVGRGLALMKAAEIEAAKTNGLSPNFNTGLLPSEATVTFNIAANASNSNQLMIDLSAPPTIPVKAGATDTFSSSASGSRANQITIKFSSLYFNTASSGTNNATAKGAGGSSDLNDPDTVKQIVSIIKDNNATNGPVLNIYDEAAPVKLQKTQSKSK